MIELFFIYIAGKNRLQEPEMNKKIIVLGTGLVGSAMARDLAGSCSVTAADLNTDSFDSLKSHGVATRQADLSVPGEIASLVRDYDLVIGALPGHMGYRSLEAVIEAGKNIVDISFMPDDYLKLNRKAVEKGVTAVVDCGVAPGMGNLILGYHNKRMEVEDFRCYVGGLPLVREWPFEYKAVFSPIDVIEEYTRPARFVRNGKIITREALSDVELMNFDGIGSLESWNSDGLRSLITTVDVPNMIEKTLRYPGTTEYIRVLRAAGFFSYDAIKVGGNSIKPIDLTAGLLFPKWKLGPGEGDLTVMRILVSGKEGKQDVRYIYDLYDEYDRETGTISMARTTGFTATAVAHLLIEGDFTRPGVCPPEYIGEEKGNLEKVIAYLAARKVEYKVTRENL